MAGRNSIILTKEQKNNAIAYVKRSGFYWVRLSKYLEISFKTLKRICKDDEDFSNALKRADAEFVGDIVAETRKKTPSFILKTKYKKEFPEKIQIGGEGGKPIPIKVSMPGVEKWLEKQVKKEYDRKNKKQ